MKRIARAVAGLLVLAALSGCKGGGLKLGKGLGKLKLKSVPKLRLGKLKPRLRLGKLKSGPKLPGGGAKKVVRVPKKVPELPRLYPKSPGKVLDKQIRMERKLSGLLPEVPARRREDKAWRGQEEESRRARLRRERREYRVSTGRPRYAAAEGAAMGVMIAGGACAVAGLYAVDEDPEVRGRMLLAGGGVALGGWIAWGITQQFYDRRWTRSRTMLLLGPRGCGIARRF